uniref:Uncharacterized protein n=1 Tax=Cynoglossus semilaevis TaxID=244447 RepID=A0A3P8WMS9_CYNSE
MKWSHLVTMQVSPPPGGFHRPVGRGQPLVRMPRSQPSLQSRQSIRAPPLRPPVSPQPSLKRNGPPSPQPSVRRLQGRPLSPQPLRHSPSFPAHPASPIHHLSQPPSPLPLSVNGTVYYPQTAVIQTKGDRCDDHTCRVKGSTFTCVRL